MYKPVMMVGDTAVSLMEFRDMFLQLYKEPGPDDTPELVWETVYQEVLMRNLFALEAKERGWDVEPEILSEWETKELLWVGDYFGYEYAKRSLKVDNEILDKMIPDTYRAMKIHQISTQDLASAQEARQRVLDGEDFGEIARRYSTDMVSHLGGEVKEIQIMGLNSYYDLELLERLAPLGEGEISNVMDAGLGYSFFRIDENRPLSPQERNSIRIRLRMEVRADLEETYLLTVKETFPMKIDKGALENALGTGREETVVARVGNTEVTFHVLKNFVEKMLQKNPGYDSVDIWEGYLRRMEKSLALREQALSEGFLDNENVRENLARVRKYSLSDTFAIRLERSIEEPTDEEVYRFYRQEVAPRGVRGIFSVEGASGLSPSQAEKVAQSLGKGLSLEEALAAVPVLPGSQVKEVVGTFGDDDFSEVTLLELERTPVGKVTEPVQGADGFSVFRINGKARGESATFDQVYSSSKRSLMDRRIFRERRETIARQHSASPIKHLYSSEELKEVVLGWLELQVLLVGKDGKGASPH
jgi:hypothetical protein